MIKKKKLSACIVTYNNEDTILGAVDSLLAFTENMDFTLYISDNDSKDNTLEIIRKKYSDRQNLIILDNKKNLGFGHGHNAVLPILESEYHFIVNPDIVINNETIPRIIQYLDENLDVGMLCPKILNEDQTEQILPVRNPKFKYYVSRFFGIFPKIDDEYTMKYERNSDVLDIEFCTGCFMVIRTSIFKKLKGFDERYFMYCEDADLSREVNQVARVVMYRDANVTHRWEREWQTNKKILYIHAKSILKYFWKWKF